MENLSQIAVDESSVSMYFSFNSTATCKTLENSNDFSVQIEDENFNLNDTLGKKDQTLDQCQTVKKLSIGVSPDNRLPRSILRTYETLSSTPNEAQLLRSVEINRGSCPDVMNVCELGLNFLESPKEAIQIIPPEEKENQSSQKVVHTERNSDLSKIQKGIPKLKISSAGHESDVATKRPLKSASSKNVSTSNDIFRLTTDQNCPKKITSAFNIAKRLSSNRKSVSKQETPFHIPGKTTRMSIVKTTLNSPAQKLSKRTLSQMGRNRPSCFTILPKTLGSEIDSKATHLASISETHKDKGRKSTYLKKTISCPEKRIDSVDVRKSCIPSSLVKNFTKITDQKELVPVNTIHNKFAWPKLPSYLKKEFVCEICSRKFVVFSLFEAHKKSHNIVSNSASAKSTLSLTIDNKCRYCDKHFAISKALRNHLVENCIKIPPGDKKKLLFSKELKIETQTKLPSKSTSEPCNHSNNSNKSNRRFTFKVTVPPTTSNQIKQKRAHSGVYCTPNKQIICHICNMHFNNILAFTEHKLSHSNIPNAGLSQTENELAADKNSQRT